MGDLFLVMLSGYWLFGFSAGVLMGSCFVSIGTGSSMTPKDLPAWMFILMFIMALPYLAGVLISLERREED